MISEFTAKKLGEVLAFAVVGEETVEKARKGLAMFLSPQRIDELVAKSQVYREAIVAFSKKHDVEGMTEEKSKKTAEKIISMREIYIKDEAWENPAEVCEWLGFFAGAAEVHWYVLKGVAEALEDDEFLGVVYDAIGLYSSMLDGAAEFLSNIGRTGAK